MRQPQTIHSILFRIAPVGLAIGLVLTATQAYGYYGGGHGYGYGGHGYGYGDRSYGYGGRGYGYGGRGYGYGGHGYGHYGGHRGYGYYGGHHYGGLVYGLLSIPSAVVGTLFGYHRSPGYYGGTYGNHSTIPPATGPAGNAAPPRGGAYGGDSTTPPATGPGGNAAPPSGGAHGGDSTPPPATRPGGNDASQNNGPGTIDGGGWARLAEGRYSQALSIFAAQASGRPNEGRPKVGFALSAAAGGDLRRGVWAMRRAMRIDPNSMHYMTIDQPLRSRVEQLVTRYNDDAGRTVRNAEAAFMLASLHYLLGDMNSARNAVDQAVADGDPNSSTSNLKHLIGVDLTPDTQRERPTDREPPANGTLRSVDYQ